jgi:hypothetical protein
MDSIGEPEPLLVRVFGTLNAPGVYGQWIAALLVLSFAFHCRLTMPAQAIGVLALLFSQVRTSWGSLGLALLICLLPTRQVTARTLWRVVVPVALATAVVAAVSLTFPDVADGFLQRLDSFSNLSEDGSTVARLELHRMLFEVIDKTPLGVGLGSLGRGAVAITYPSIGLVDSGPIEVLLTLGWVAGTLYCLALAGTFLSGLPRWPQSTVRHRVLFAAAAAMLFHFPITNLPTFPGTTMWVIFGLAIAAKRGLSRVAAPAAPPPLEAPSTIAIPP